MCSPDNNNTIIARRHRVQPYRTRRCCSPEIDLYAMSGFSWNARKRAERHEIQIRFGVSSHSDAAAYLICEIYYIFYSRSLYSMYLSLSLCPYIIISVTLCEGRVSEKQNIFANVWLVRLVKIARPGLPTRFLWDCRNEENNLAGKCHGFN